MIPAFFLLLALGLSADAGPAVLPRNPATRAAQGDGLSRDTLAWVGTRAITGADLVRRIEWMPWPEKQGAAGMDSAKVRALQSLAGESLLAQEAEREAPGDSDRVALMRRALRKALIRDALYHEVVRALPAVSPAEIDGIVRHQGAHLPPAKRRALRVTVADSLKAAGERERAAEFMGRVLGPQRAVVDSAVFMLLADSLQSLMAASREERASAHGYVLLPEDVDVMLARLGPVLSRPLVRLADGPLLLGDALEELRYYTLSVHSLDSPRFAVELSARLRDVVAGELMAREGLRRHLDGRPEVRRDLEMWTSVWHAQRLLARAGAGPEASDDEAFRHLALFHPARARQVCEVDVAEILSDSQERAARLRSLLDAGSSLDSLARMFTTRPEWSVRGGRSGFFPIVRHPDLGYAALLSPIGSLTGPMRLPEGHSVFRVLGKRLAPDSLAARALLERMRGEATADRRAEREARYVAGLAARSRVEFDYAALSGIDVLPASMVTKRFLGFGGVMLAAPSLPPLWDWVQVWRAAHEALP
jgi:hypothetical protein